MRYYDDRLPFLIDVFCFLRKQNYIAYKIYVVWCFSMNIISDHNLYKIGVRVKVKVCTKGTWVNLLALETFLSVPLAFFNS